MLLVVRTKVTTSIRWVEAKEAVKHSTLHRMAPHKNYSAKSAETEEFYYTHAGLSTQLPSNFFNGQLKTWMKRPGQRWIW
jgi:hypothetical protein